MASYTPSANTHRICWGPVLKYQQESIPLPQPQAEELVFALITMCPVGISLELGFGQGPGGSEAAAHAALMGLRFHRRSEPVLFRRALPGMQTLEMMNRIRTVIMENWACAEDV